MHDTALMRYVDGVGQRGNECSRLASRLRMPLDFLSEVATLNELHREVRPAGHVANVVDLHDVGVAQAGDRLRLAQEALQLYRPGAGVGQQHLQGDRAVEAQVPRPVDDAHAAAAEQRLHPVAGNLRHGGGMGSGRARVRARGCLRVRKQRRE